VGMTFAFADGWEQGFLGRRKQALNCDILETNVETWMITDMDVFLIGLRSHTRKIITGFDKSDACSIKGWIQRRL